MLVNARFLTTGMFNATEKARLKFLCRNKNEIIGNESPGTF